MAVQILFVVVGLSAGVILGILIGRYYVPDDRLLKRSARHGQSYAKALNYVLASDRDSAAAELKEVISENVADIEPYFALAALFRSQGKWERAIRAHQAIAARESQSKNLRLRALYELGLDFRTAGMPRRATRAMEQCLEIEEKHEGALYALCGLYEEQGHYARAAATWRRLSKMRGTDVRGPATERTRTHHLLCAAAQQAIAAGDFAAARRHLREAKKTGASVHMLAAAAELAAAQNKPEDAVAQLERALTIAPELAVELVPRLLAAQREHVLEHPDGEGESLPSAAAQPEGRDLEERAAQAAARVASRVLSQIGRNGPLELSLAELRSHYDPATALADYRRIGEEFPDLLPARLAAARLALASDDPSEVERELRALAASGGALDWATEGSFRCSACGRREDEFGWRCPQCRQWGTAVLDLGRDEGTGGAAAQAVGKLMPSGGVQRALQGASRRALPAPSTPAMPEAEDPGSETSFMGRVGGFFTGAWSGLRGGKPRAKPEGKIKAAPEAALPPATSSDSVAESVAEPVAESPAGKTAEPVPDEQQPESEPESSASRAKNP